MSQVQAATSSSVIVHSDKELKAGQITLGLLAAKQVLNLTAANFDTPLGAIFSSHVVQGLPAAARPLIDRLTPLLDLSPHQLFADKTNMNLPFLRAQLAGISGEKTFRDAFCTKLFQLALKNPDCPALVLWEHVSRNQPVLEDDWKKFPPELKRLYGFMPLLKEIPIREFIPEQAGVTEELSPAQLKGAWKLWTEYFKGLHCGLLRNKYDHLTRLAEDHLFVTRGVPRQLMESSIFKKIPKAEMVRLFSPDCMSFLLKYERLAVFEKKIGWMERQLDQLQDNPVLLRALIHDHLRPVHQMICEISVLAQSLEHKYKDYSRRGTPYIFVDQSLKVNGDRKLLERAHNKTAEQWHDICLNASVSTLLSDYLCKSICTSLKLEGPSSGKIFLRAEESLRRNTAYHSLAIDDFDEPAPLASEPHAATEVKEVPPEPVVERILPAAPIPVAPGPDHLKLQLDADLRFLDRPEIFGSVTPYAATLAQSTKCAEVGEHLYLMVQGLELYADAIRRNDRKALPLILRNILIDGHVALERFFVDRIVASGRPNPQVHDLKILAEMTGLVFTEEERGFLESARLALYWARYPVCSEEYFGDRENQPPLLRALLNLSDETAPEVDRFIQHALAIVVPKDLVSDLFRRKLQLMASQPLPPVGALEPGRFQPFIDAITDTIRRCERADDTHVASAISHLKEVTYYLRWIEQSKRMEEPCERLPLKFWFQRNALEVDKLFKHLFAALLLLEGHEDPRQHRHSQLFEALGEFYPLNKRDERVIQSFNMGNALHYHNRPSPLHQAYPDLLKEDLLQCHAFTSGKRVPPWAGFDEAIKLFEPLLRFTLGKLRSGH